jgi:ribulose-phosphate 3-epimerase
VGVVISPSVLNVDLARLSHEVARIESAADWVHLDVMDYAFVPNISFGLPVIESLMKHTTLPADCHLMIADPDRWAPGYAEAGAASVTFHIEAAANPVHICKDIHRHGARAGVAVKPGTALHALESCFSELDMILVMTVEPGWGGQSFMTEMLAKVAQARQMVGDGDVLIQVDGGIDERSITLAAEAGANVFVAGSAVFRSSDPSAMVHRLRTLAKDAGARKSS